MEAQSNQPIIVHARRNLRLKTLLSGILVFLFMGIWNTIIIQLFLADSTIARSHIIWETLIIAYYLALNMICIIGLRALSIQWKIGKANHTLLTISAQGITLDSWQRTDGTLIPWKEIAWLGADTSTNIGGLLAIRLRNSTHWWATYGNGKRRHFLFNPFTQAHFTFSQGALAIPAIDILRQTQQAYQDQLIDANVAVRFPGTGLFLTTPETAEVSFKGDPTYPSAKEMTIRYALFFILLFAMMFTGNIVMSKLTSWEYTANQAQGQFYTQSQMSTEGAIALQTGEAEGRALAMPHDSATSDDTQQQANTGYPAGWEETVDTIPQNNHWEAIQYNNNGTVITYTNAQSWLDTSVSIPDIQEPRSGGGFTF